MITAASIDYNFLFKLTISKKENTRFKTELLNNSYS